MRVSPNKILIIHSAAIGDAVLGTPVPMRLKRAFPDAEMTYYTYSSLKPLLALCPAIDRFVDYDRKASVLDVASTVRQQAPDLVVDLNRGLKWRLLPFMTPGRWLHYRKQPAHARPIQHAADNFLETISQLVPGDSQVFPTLFPSAELLASVSAQLPARASIIGLVPSVGSLRPHRAWPPDYWVRLAKEILRIGSIPVLVGGPDDLRVCDPVASQVDGALNFCAKLSLPETAALLKQCQAVVTGDTGPSHIAVAVGTPVLGLLGPTYPERSGPYHQPVIEQTASCLCHHVKSCTITGAGAAGSCMGKIQPSAVFEQLRTLLACDQNAVK